MDFTLIGGIILALVCIVGSFLWEGGAISALVQGPAMLIIFGGTIFATIVGLPFKKLIGSWKVFKKAVVDDNIEIDAVINELVMACETARREGLLALQKDIDKLKLPFAQKYMKMFINGTDPQLMKEMAEMEIEAMTERHSFGANIFAKMGGYSPTMGVIGTVMGLISTFMNAGGEPEKLIHSIASAFIATYWGVLLANIIFLPTSDKLKNKHQEEVLVCSIVIEGIMAINEGFSPRVLRTKLTSMLPIEKQNAMVQKSGTKKVAAKI